MRPVLPALFKLSPRLRPEPDLVEAWPSETDITTGPFTVTLTLRDARWSDGVPISARDVRFSWERLRQGPTGYRYRFLTDVEELGARRVRLHFDRPVRRWWSLFSLDDMVLPAHAYSDEWDTGPTVSGGPFRVAAWQEGLRVRLLRNDDYLGPRALLAGIDVLFVPDEETRLQLLDRGELDAVFAEGDVNMGRRARALGFDPVTGALDGRDAASGAWGPSWWELDLDAGRLGTPTAAAVIRALDPALVAEILEDSGQVMNGIPGRFPVAGARRDGLPSIPGPWSGRGGAAGVGSASVRLSFPRGSTAGAIARFAHFRLRDQRITVELAGLESDAFERSLDRADRAPAVLRLRRGADAPDAGSYRGTSGEPGASGDADADIDRAETGSAQAPRGRGPVTGVGASAWSRAQQRLATTGSVAPLARVRTWIVGRAGVVGPQALGASTGPFWNASSWQVHALN